MKLLLKLILLFQFSIFTIITLHAQSILWHYEVEADVINLPSTYWLDSEGTGYFNIKKQNPKNKQYYDQNLYLLMLDKNGQLKGTTYINNCKGNTWLLPFGENRLLSSGRSCNPDSDEKPTDSNVFDYEGNLMKKGTGFKGRSFTRIKTPIGYSFFSKPKAGFGFDYLSIGHIDTNFKISYDSVSMELVKKPNLGIVNVWDDPVLMNNKTWVVPLNYGPTDGPSIAIDHGHVIGIKGDQVAWQYPDTLSDFSLKYIASTSDKVAIFMRKSRNSEGRLIVLLDQNGKEIKHFYIYLNARIDDMLMTEDHIVLMSNFNIYWYDYDGNLISKFKFNDHPESQNLNRKNGMQQDKDGNIYFLASKHGTSMIFKIGFNNNLPTEEEEEEEESNQALDIEKSLKSPAINAIQFDHVSKELYSVSIFPNPASIYINFEIHEDYVIEESFSLRIFTSDGKLMEEKSLTERKYELSLAAYPAGTYFYSILLKQNNKQEIVSGRFVKIGK